MSCCPPNSHKYLASDYAEKGSCHRLSDGTEYYVSGAPNGTKGILFIPDIYGWHGGRTRNLADQFYEAGYYAVVPKLLVPALNGGTDGDGCPEAFEFADLVTLLKSNVTWKGKHAFVIMSS